MYVLVWFVSGLVLVTTTRAREAHKSKNAGPQKFRYPPLPSTQLPRVSGLSVSMLLQLQSNASASYILQQLPIRSSLPQNQIPSPLPLTSPSTRRRALSLITITTFFSDCCFCSNYSWSKPAASNFVELPASGGVKALDLRIGDGQTPSNGDKVVIHYYGRLAAKQGWRFDSTYDHKDENGEPIPFEFVLGSSKVISGIDSAVRSMKVGGIRRVIIPPSEGYQNTSQEPIPPNFFDRQRLFTTIFNPTRLANGEGSTLGILIFDVELVSVRRGLKHQEMHHR